MERLQATGRRGCNLISTPHGSRRHSDHAPRVLAGPWAEECPPPGPSLPPLMAFRLWSDRVSQ